MIYFLLPSLLFIPVSEEKIIQMVFLVNQNFFEISEFSGAIAWLKSSPFFAFTFLKYNNVDLKYVFQNILFLHFIIVFLYLLFINNFFKYGKYFFIFTFLSFFGPLILFFVWFDWGRLVYIIYNFCLIFTFFCLHNNTEVFNKIDKITVINNLDYKFKLIFTISYIGLWTPKIFYNDNVVLFPLITLIRDLVKYSIKYGSLLI
tara:strand:+ start:135 stop:743 length:609 start_codon:yes stop_codon:yes gene_type:complete